MSDENSYSKLKMEAFDKTVDIRKYLPHRGSMLMVDELIKLTKDFVKTEFKINKNNIFLQHKRFIESGLVENIAQTCSVIAGSTYFNVGDERKENKSEVIGYISAIKSVSIYQLPKVDSVLISEGSMLSRFDFDNYLTCTMKGQVWCNNELQLDCLLNLFIKNNRNER